MQFVCKDKTLCQKVVSLGLDRFEADVLAAQTFYVFSAFLKVDCGQSHTFQLHAKAEKTKNV